MAQENRGFLYTIKGNKKVKKKKYLGKKGEKKEIRNELTQNKQVFKREKPGKEELEERR